jgi:hypothetical protein
MIHSLGHDVEPVSLLGLTIDTNRATISPGCGDASGRMNILRYLELGRVGR